MQTKQRAKGAKLRGDADRHAEYIELERKTLEQAWADHPEAFIRVIDRLGVGGEAWPAIYVWSTEEDSRDDDGANCEAVYWLLPADPVD